MPISVKSVDPKLTDEDIMEMVNAGLLPATVTISIRADSGRSTSSSDSSPISS